MVFIDAEKPQLFGCGVQIGFGILLRGFGLFEGALGDRALLVKSLRPFELYARQPLIVLGFQIGLVRSGDIVALDSQQ